eukprot:406032-Ditylum_brightwellii.AAC.1
MTHRRVEEQEALSYHLHREYIDHFGRSQGTPGTVHPISILFGQDTNTQFGEEFSRGLVKVQQFPGITSILQHYFQEL